MTPWQRTLPHSWSGCRRRCIAGSKVRIRTQYASCALVTVLRHVVPENMRHVGPLQSPQRDPNIRQTSVGALGPLQSHQPPSRE